MKLNSIKCEVVDVRTETGVCIGVAKTKLGEQYIIDGRTPETGGMCSNAFCALSNKVFIMMTSDEKTLEKTGYQDRVCPDGVVTFRLSKSESDKPLSYTTK